MTYDDNGSPNEGISNTNLELIALMNWINIIEANEFVCETRLNRYSSIDWLHCTDFHQFRYTRINLLEMTWEWRSLLLMYLYISLAYSVFLNNIQGKYEWIDQFLLPTNSIWLLHFSIWSN